MAKYIEREAAIQEVKHAWSKGLEPSQYIEIIPAADVVPVVRCRECKRWRRYTVINKGFGMCRKSNTETGETGFCSYGERRTGNV